MSTNKELFCQTYNSESTSVLVADKNDKIITIIISNLLDNQISAHQTASLYLRKETVEALGNLLNNWKEFHDDKN